MRTASHPYKPASYATVVDAACQWPIVPEGTAPCTSENVIIMPPTPVEMIRAEHVELAKTSFAVVVTEGFDDVAIVAGLKPAPAFTCCTKLGPNDTMRETTNKITRPIPTTNFCFVVSIVM